MMYPITLTLLQVVALAAPAIAADSDRSEQPQDTPIRVLVFHR
jgi:hypothetical protein